MAAAKADKDAGSKPAASEKPAASTAETPAKPAVPAAISAADFKKNVGLIVRATDTNQSRVVSRAIRNTTAIRARVSGAVLAEAVETYVSDDHPAKAAMLSLLASYPPPKTEAAPPVSADPVAGEAMDTSEDRCV